MKIMKYVEHELEQLKSAFFVTTLLETLESPSIFQIQEMYAWDQLVSMVLSNFESDNKK